MDKWKVKLTDEAGAQLKSLLQKRLVNQVDVKVLLRWVFEMEEFGPDFIASSAEWHDHELSRSWRGYRSSAFSSSGRVIYKVFKNQIIVTVHRVTTDHNYKR